MVDVYSFDLLGTFVFALYGANVALNKKLNLFGISVAGFLTAVGGGTIRCILSHKLPFYFFDNHYTMAIALGVTVALATYRFFQRIHFHVLIIDAIGLVTFAYIGAYTAENYHLGVFIVVFFAALTATGGGILRDVFIGETSSFFLEGFQVVPPILLAVVYHLFLSYMTQALYVYGLLAFFFVMQVISIKWNIKLWVPFQKLTFSRDAQRASRKGKKTGSLMNGIEERETEREVVPGHR